MTIRGGFGGSTLPIGSSGSPAATTTRNQRRFRIATLSSLLSQHGYPGNREGNQIGFHAEQEPDQRGVVIVARHKVQDFLPRQIIVLQEISTESFPVHSQKELHLRRHEGNRRSIQDEGRQGSVLHQGFDTGDSHVTNILCFFFLFGGRHDNPPEPSAFSQFSPIVSIGAHLLHGPLAAFFLYPPHGFAGRVHVQGGERLIVRLNGLGDGNGVEVGLKFHQDGS